MLGNLKIGTRLALGFGGVILAGVAAFAGAVLLGRQSQADTTAAAQAAQVRANAVHAMLELQLRLVSAIRHAGLLTDGGLINQAVDAYRQDLLALKKHEAEFGQLDLGADEKAALATAAALRQQAEPMVEEAMSFTLAFAGDEAAKTLTGKFAPVQAQWAQALKQLSHLQQQHAAASAQAIASTNDRRSLALAALLVLVAVAAAGFAVLLTRSVTRPLRAAAELAARVAQGDLSVGIAATGHDEAAQLLRSLQAMTRQLSGMVAAVHESSAEINLASAEISSGNHDLSCRTEHAASALQQTSATLAQLTGIVASNLGHARQAQAVVERTGQIAEQGGTAMGAVVSTMQGISDSSHRIADIIGVIDGIAFQTNILALNAAVEAARAGEQGRGFAVVASEVRALAQRVSGAAAEVRSLIKESVQRVDTGARLVGTMGGTMTELVGGVAQVRALIADISTASGQQDDRIRQVSSSVLQIDDSTRQNAALVEQVAAAAQSMSGQTQRLAELVSRFKLGQAAPG